MEKINLNLVPLDDLLSEIENRFDASVFMGVQHNGGYDVSRTSMNGSRVTCLGFTELLRDKILSELTDVNQEEVS